MSKFQRIKKLYTQTNKTQELILTTSHTLTTAQRRHLTVSTRQSRTNHVNNPKLLEYSFRARMAEGEPDGGGYVQIPADCVNMCAESLGIAVTQDVIPALAEDVNYRVREATQVRIATDTARRRSQLCS